VGLGAQQASHLDIGWDAARLSTAQLRSDELFTTPKPRISKHRAALLADAAPTSAAGNSLCASTAPVRQTLPSRRRAFPTTTAVWIYQHAGLCVQTPHVIGPPNVPL
jgi:hypothetical protein